MGEAEGMPSASEDGLLTAWRWNKNAKEQVQLKQKIKDLPGLLKHGLHLRKKSVEALPDTTPGPSSGYSKHKACLENFPCAGRALRNAFLSHGPYPAKDRINLARIIRRSYVGLELVQWLLEQCLFIQCRMMATKVWQVLLELGILLSVDQHIVFEDSNTYYQFSFEECETQGCEFRNEAEWQNAVRLLLQLVPYVQFRVGVVTPPHEETQGRGDISAEILQMKALERLTSTVQNELAVALARKARKSMAEEDSPEPEESREKRTQSPAEEKQGGVCTLHDKEEMSRLEMVQRLAKDGCRFLQTQNSKALDRSVEPHSVEALRVCLKERGQNVLVLQRVSSERPPPPASAGGGRQEEKDRRPFPHCRMVLSLSGSSGGCRERERGVLQLSAQERRAFPGQSVEPGAPVSEPLLEHAVGRHQAPIQERRAFSGQSVAPRAPVRKPLSEHVVGAGASAGGLGRNLPEHAAVTAVGWGALSMCSAARLHSLDLRLPAALVEEEEDDEDEEGSDDGSSSSGGGGATSVSVPTFDVPYFRYIDEEGEEETEEEWSSSRSLSSAEDDSTDSSSVVSDRYVVVSGTPEKILEHLLSDLRLDDGQVTTQGKEAETLLDDFLLTYLVFMSTNDLCQALLGQYPFQGHWPYWDNRYRGKEEGKEALYRKRKVLHLVSQWSALYRDFLRDDEQVKLFMKTLYRYALDDLYEYPSLEKDLKEFQKLLRMHRRHTVDEYSPHRKNKALSHQLSLKENWLQPRGPQRETREVFCHVYVTMDSYLSVRTPVTVVAQDLLHAVSDRLEYPEEDMVLVTVTYPGEKLILQPHDSIYSESLTTAGRLLVCHRDLTEIMNPFTDNAELQQRPVRLLGMNTWDLSVALTNFDWSLFSSIHEQELIYHTFSRQAGGGHTVALDLLLQRCNEVQLWVMTEVLLCASLCKRVQLFKKFIKIAAHCKAQRNLNSFFAIIMGLNTAAVSRLNQTWEKVPGKFKKLFSELETLTDPSLNHKAYREAFKKMKPPKIPFMPLLLKDITFIHEGNKTFLDNLVNFEKLHMIADSVRLIRHCQTDHMGNEVAQKDSQDVRTYVHHLHVIDNQQTLFELSHRLEPRV
ncbi:hypothetical protein AGOR_G00211460 [Albula goreensis]|uniref:Rap guanine nucleotide exchange factor 5 n=1 Tax=Albula goreensis TaxID=1534307 RepID=A0A8T3CRK2_9TELE|nr:hypothetical protein AGOR_G00211460 [Albula goreensis]